MNRSFWCTGPLGLAQHDDFYDVLAQNVHVHRADIVSMDSDSILLDSGLCVRSDTLFCGTGWKTNYPFLPPSLTIQLGLPHPTDDDTVQDRELWTALLDEADKRVIAEFPYLRNPPQHVQPSESTKATTTARLYNAIAPLTDPSIVFLGRAHLSNSFRMAEAQAIWATAYFDGKATIPPIDQAQKEVAYMNAFSRRRYPSKGWRGEYIFFELVWYTDKLLAEVGLNSHREKGWWGNLVEPCLAADFKRVVKEYKDLYGS